MNLNTQYLGIKLKNPLVVGASPLSNDLDAVKKMEDNGAAAITMHSLFEEQINYEMQALDEFLMQGTDTSAEALSYFPEPDEYHNLAAEEYLKQITQSKAAVDIPVIGSLNGVSAGGWMEYAKKIEQAGADALELNIYYIPTDVNMTSDRIEAMYIEALKTVKNSIKIPVTIKLNPYFSALANMAKKLDNAGADGLVLFNRFYQPDIDLEELKIEPGLQLSTPYELRLPLRWMAILYGQIKASMAASSGIHSAGDVLKVVMAGADVAMMVSVLFEKGIDHLGKILKDLEEWMDKHEYESVEQMKGSMSHKSVAEPAAYVRANYMKTLQSIR